MNDSLAFVPDALLGGVLDGVMTRELPPGLDVKTAFVRVKFALAAGIADENFSHVLDRGVLDRERPNLAALDKRHDRVL